jgi:hypothetical protein
MPDGAGHAGDPPRGARDRGGASACGRAAGRLRRVEQQLDELDLDREGEVRERRRGRVHRGRMRRLPHTRRRPQSRDGRSQPRPAQAQHGDGREAGRERRRRDAGIPWTAPPAQIHAVAQFVAQNASNSSARASGSACPPWTCATPAEASVWLPVSSTLAGRPTQHSDPRCAGYRSARGGGVGVSPFGEDRGSGRAWTGAPAFLFRRGSARFAMGRVSRLSPRSREHFRARATGRDALRGTRKPSACRLSVGRGPSPFVVPVAVPVTDRSPQGAGR